MWHPKNEAEACSEQAALIEFLRATRGWDALDPAGLAAWKDQDPAGYAAAYQGLSGGTQSDVPMSDCVQPMLPVADPDEP
jgi:hypothetical protein